MLLLQLLIMLLIYVASPFTAAAYVDGGLVSTVLKIEKTKDHNEILNKASNRCTKQLRRPLHLYAFEFEAIRLIWF